MKPSIIIGFILTGLATYVLTMRKVSASSVPAGEGPWGFEVHLDGTSSPIDGTGIPSAQSIIYRGNKL